jgi:hypothetical protein
MATMKLAKKDGKAFLSFELILQALPHPAVPHKTPEADHTEDSRLTSRSIP